MCLIGLTALAGTALAQPDVDDPAYCLTCHGAAGQGNPAIDAPVLAGMSSDYLRRQLEDFRSGRRGANPKDTVGAEMHGIARTMSDAGIERAVTLIASLPARGAADAKIPGDAVAGEPLYQQCSACHGSDAAGNEALSAPGLHYQQSSYLRRQLTHFRDGVRGTADGDTLGQQMAASSAGLSDDDIVNVVAYIKSLNR